MHYVGRSFRLLNPPHVRPCAFGAFSGRKFHHAEIFYRKPEGKRGVPQGRTNFDEEGENRPFRKYHSSDGIAYLLLHLFQLVGQDFHVAADLLVGYPGIYLGGFQIRMPQKTAYGLDGHTVREQHGGGVRMPGNMIGQPYLETALPAKFLQYGVASAVARYRKYMIVLGQPLVLLYDALGNVQQADVGLGVCLAPAVMIQRLPSKKVWSRSVVSAFTSAYASPVNTEKMKRSRTSSQVPLFTGASISVCISRSVR